MLCDNAPARISQKALITFLRTGLEQAGEMRLPLRGRSMWPTIPAGSLVRVEPINGSSVQRGDILVWQRKGVFVAHRVVDIKSDDASSHLLLKGDNCPVADAPVSREAIIGRVSAIERNGRDVRRQSLRYRLESAFWVWRWHLARAREGVRLRLPTLLRRPLGLAGRALGACLWYGFLNVFHRKARLERS
ncbi:MAG: signal peptidase I [Anaerolineae bacterium]